MLMLEVFLKQVVIKEKVAWKFLTDAITGIEAQGIVKINVDE